MAEEDMDLLLSDARQLLKEAEALIGIYSSSEPLFSSFDTKADCNVHLQPFKEAWEEMKEEAEHKARCISFEEYCKRKGFDPVHYRLGGPP